MDKKQIIAFAKKNGYDGISPLGKWRGYDVYEPTFNGSDEKNPSIVGLPFNILVKGDEIRMSTIEEAFAYIDDMNDDIDEIEYED